MWYYIDEREHKGRRDLEENRNEQKLREHLEDWGVHSQGWGE